MNSHLKSILTNFPLSQNFVFVFMWTCMKNYSGAAYDLPSFQANSLTWCRNFTMTSISINTRPKANTNQTSMWGLSAHMKVFRKFNIGLASSWISYAVTFCLLVPYYDCNNCKSCDWNYMIKIGSRRIDKNH